MCLCFEIMMMIHEILTYWFHNIYDQIKRKETAHDSEKDRHNSVKWTALPYLGRKILTHVRGLYKLKKRRRSNSVVNHLEFKWAVLSSHRAGSNRWTSICLCTTDPTHCYWAYSYNHLNHPRYLAFCCFMSQLVSSKIEKNIQKIKPLKKLTY